MGYQELVASLRKDAEETIHSIWREADTEIERLKEDASKRINAMRVRYEDIKIRSLKETRKGIINEALKREMEIRLKAEDALSQRLFKLCLNSLGILRDGDYDLVFSMLVKEIPEQKWGRIKVNPDDIDIAKRYFPDTEIITDKEITGGFIAITGDERICVINTFEKRLERTWESLLPQMIRDIHEAISNKTS